MNEVNLIQSEIKFITELSGVSIKELKTEITEDIVKDYEIIFLNLENVICKIDDGQNLFKKLVLDRKSLDLIKFIKDGNKLIPPILIFINNGLWSILDGKHRMGLFRHLDIITVPFLVRKNHKTFAEELK